MNPDDIRKLRRCYGMTQVEFGRALGLTGDTIYSWERKDQRRRPVRFDVVVLLRLKEMKEGRKSYRTARAALMAAAARPGDDGLRELLFALCEECRQP